MFFSVVLSLLIQETLTSGLRISVHNGGPWGDWGIIERCPPKTSAIGFSLKVERPVGGIADDTALNGIKLYCAAPSSKVQTDPITSAVGSWGVWTSDLWCPSGNLISFALKVEKPQGGGDDTAANNIMMRCSDNTTLETIAGPWGEYGDWSETCPTGICGIITRVEKAQGVGDDTALNDVQFRCCN